MTTQHNDQITNTAAADQPASPAPRSTGRGHHMPTARESVEGCLAYLAEASAHLKDPAAHPAATVEHLFRGLPHGSITEAYRADRPEGAVVAWRIGERNPRFTVPTGLLILKALTLFGGFPFIDTNKKGGREQHYVEVLAEGYTLQRLMTGAGSCEVARLLGDHHDLLPWTLAIEAGHPRARRDRQGAIKLALALYDRNAVAWGLSQVISRARYEAVLKGAFRLFDAEHGRHLLRAEVV